MSIVNITDRERELENALAEEQRLNGMGAEREYVLRGKIEQLARELGQAANMIQTTAMERDALKAELGDLPNSQAEMMSEIKALKEAISLAYGHLWHINNEPLAPIPLYSPEQATYKARKFLFQVMTNAERCIAINAVRAALTRSKP